MKKLISVFLAATLAASLAGCSAPGGTASSPAASGGSGNSASAAGEPAPKEAVNIRIMHFFNDKDTSPEAGAYRAALKQFLADNPNVTVEEDKAGDDIDQKVRILGASNELPDLYVSKADTISSFVQSGQAQPVNLFLDADPEWKDGFLNGVFAEYTYNDGIYGIPFRQAFNNMVFYNKELFKKAGIKEFPKTYDEFKKAAAAIKEQGYVPVVLGNKDKWPGESVMFNTIADKFTGNTWVTGLMENSGPKFTDAPFVEACKVAQEMYATGVFNQNINSVDVNYAKAQYLNEKAAMFIGGSWDMSIINEDDPLGVIAKTSLALFPEFKDGVTERLVGNAVGWAFMLNAKVAPGVKLDMCVGLLKALSSKQFATDSAQAGGIPVVKNNSIDETKLHPLQVLMTNEILPAFTPAPLYDTLLPANVTDTLYTGFQEMLIGLKSAEDYAAEVQAEMESTY